MNKKILLCTITLFSSLSFAKDFSKEIVLGSNYYDFSAQFENKVDQFGKNIVEFTNPRIDGVAILIASGNVIEVKKQLCDKLGFKSVDGFGTASQPSRYLLDINQDGILKGRFENSTTTDMFRCLGSIEKN